MSRFSWRAAPITVGAAFLAFALAGCWAADGAKSENALVANEPAPTAQSGAPVEQSEWLTSLSQGLEQAKAQNKMVLVDFHAEW